jgi:serine/threonine protein kinase
LKGLFTSTATVPRCFFLATWGWSGGKSGAEWHYKDYGFNLGYRLCIINDLIAARHFASSGNLEARFVLDTITPTDLSYNNVLVDPVTKSAVIIDLDGLVVPGLFPPEVIGTADFIAPEVVMTSHLDKHDKNRNLPKRETDLHALAVLIYMYLLYRHPLRGSKVHDLNDPVKDESLTMGEKALFIEHPLNKSNRKKLDQVKPSELPWADTEKLPYTVTGPYLSQLIKQAFLEGLSCALVPADTEAPLLYLMSAANFDLTKFKRQFGELDTTHAMISRSDRSSVVRPHVKMVQKPIRLKSQRAWVSNKLFTGTHIYFFMH